MIPAHDFRGVPIEPGDVIAYVGRQDLKAFLMEARVVESATDTHTGEEIVKARAFRSSSPMANVTDRLVTLTKMRKLVVVRKKRKR